MTRRRRSMLALGWLISCAFPTASGFGQETIDFTYDSRGRLVTVTRTGAPNDSQANYSYDKAGNRTNVTVTAPAVPSFVVNDVSATEGAALVFTVTRDGSTSPAVGVSYATSNGTAAAGSDYAATSGILAFATGETSKTVSVTTTDDLGVEGAETLTLTLSSPTGGAVIGDAAGSGTINDNDVPANNPPTPVNDTGSQQKCLTAVYTVTTNDSDPDGDYPLTVTAVTGVGFTVYSSSQVQFQSTQSTGAKVGTYTVRDSRGMTANATLTITVSGGVCSLSAPADATSAGGDGSEPPTGG